MLYTVVKVHRETWNQWEGKGILALALAGFSDFYLFIVVFFFFTCAALLIPRKLTEYHPNRKSDQCQNAQLEYEININRDCNRWDKRKTRSHEHQRIPVN